MGRENTEHTRSQCNKILEYLQKHSSITQAEAIERFDCYRLSARIFDLRERGYDIETITCFKKNEEGNVVNYAKYKLW